MDDFLDFKSVANLLHNFEFDIEREKIRWLKVKRFRFNSTGPNIVQVFYDYSDNFLTLNLVKKNDNKESSRCARS